MIEGENFMKIRNENDIKSMELYEEIKQSLNDDYIKYLKSLPKYVYDNYIHNVNDIFIHLFDVDVRILRANKYINRWTATTDNNNNNNSI